MNYSQHKEQRIGVFVDVQNMYYSAKNLYQSKVNFNEVLQTAIAGRKLVRAFAYVIRADVGSEKEFFGALEKIGFEVREKDLQIFYGGTKKGDWDVGLCMDVVRLIPKVDTMVLVSGDGDYSDLLEYAKSQGVKTEVIAFGDTTSSKLIELVDLFVDMSKDPNTYLIKDYSSGQTDSPKREKQNTAQNSVRGNAPLRSSTQRNSSQRSSPQKTDSTGSTSRPQTSQNTRRPRSVQVNRSQLQNKPPMFLQSRPQQSRPIQQKPQESSPENRNSADSPKHNN